MAIELLEGEKEALESRVSELTESLANAEMQAATATAATGALEGGNYFC